MEAYNRALLDTSNTLLDTACADGIDVDLKVKMESFLVAMKEAAESSFECIDPKRKQNYINQETWALIELRQFAREEGDEEKENELTKEIKKNARNDKKNFAVSRFEKEGTIVEKWSEIKMAKKDFMPNFTRLKDIRGNRVPHGERAEATAEYLEQVQWTNENTTPTKPNPANIVLEDTGVPDGPIQEHELDHSINALKKNKAPGPDQCTTELFKYLNREAKTLLLTLLNHLWESEQVHPEFLQASVASIFKKGDIEDLANYRPISLLNTMYKLLASIIQTRLSSHLEKHLQKTQFGFRANKSTAQALFIARRLQDYAESSGEGLIFVFLDWEKAFDKINHHRLIEALERLNIPTKVINVIKALYSQPSFRVSKDNEHSEFKQQLSGIRQGCPLSPYLFILVMSVMFYDIHSEVGESIKEGLIKGFDESEILYADDTMLVLKNDTSINTLLQAIGKESAYYGLRLNKTKCEYISMNTECSIQFSDGSLMKNGKPVTYLGGIINEKINNREEVDTRISCTLPVLNALNSFWKKAKVSTKWKIEIYSSVVVSKLLYGLETLQYNERTFSKIDTFQMK
ncbi:reverse transcriptase family protein [bacterium]|nr:reverse transcriptase family protein [bacterium]